MKPYPKCYLTQPQHEKITNITFILIFIGCYVLGGGWVYGVVRGEDLGQEEPTQGILHCKENLLCKVPLILCSGKFPRNLILGITHFFKARPHRNKDQ